MRRLAAIVWRAHSVARVAGVDFQAFHQRTPFPQTQVDNRQSHLPSLHAQAERADGVSTRAVVSHGGNSGWGFGSASGNPSLGEPNEAVVGKPERRPDRHRSRAAKRITRLCFEPRQRRLDRFVHIGLVLWQQRTLPTRVVLAQSSSGDDFAVGSFFSESYRQFRQHRGFAEEVVAVAVKVQKAQAGVGSEHDEIARNGKTRDVHNDAERQFDKRKFHVGKGVAKEHRLMVALDEVIGAICATVAAQESVTGRKVSNGLGYACNDNFAIGCRPCVDKFYRLTIRAVGTLPFDVQLFRFHGI